MTGKELQQLRKAYGLSQEALGRLLSVSMTTVNRWEGGLAPPRGLPELVLLAMRLGLAFDPHLPEKIDRTDHVEALASIFNAACARRAAARRKKP